MIELKNLCADYDRGPVLQGINASISSGEFVGVIGPNACGKTTLVKVLSGALAPKSGEVTVGGLAPALADPRDFAKLVSVVPQNTEIPFSFTGRELVEMGRYPHLGRFSPLSADDARLIDKAMEETDTVALAGRPVTEISGGERQRLIVARALAQACPLMLLDEATSAMDAHRKIDVFELLRAKNLQGATVVAVLHDLNLASQYAQRLIVMKAGRIFADGLTEAVFTEEILSAVYETPLKIVRHQDSDRPFAVFLRKS